MDRAEPGRDEVVSLEAALALAVQEAPLGIAVVDRSFRLLLVNVAMARINRRPVGEQIGWDLRLLFEGAPALEGVVRTLEQVMESGRPLRGVELETRSRSGRRWTFRCDYHPVTSGGSVVGVCCIVEETSAWREAEEQRDLAIAREHAALLESEAQVRELSRARETLDDQRAQLRVITDAVPALIALVGKDLVYRFANETYRSWFGRPPEEVVGHSVLEVIGQAGFAVVREHVQRALGGAEVKYEALIPYPTGARQVRAQLMPLQTRTGAVDGFVALVQDISSEQRRAEKLQFLAEASATLTNSLDVDETLRQLAALAVPRLADWCAIEMLEGEERSAQLAVAHVDPAKVNHAWALRERHPLDWKQRFGLPEVLRTGRPELYEQINEALPRLAAVADDDYLSAIRALGIHSAIIAPLVTRGRILGAITLVHAESGRHYDAADLALVEDLAARAALAVENARLYHEAREAVRKREDFLSIASHELKTPLTSLKLTVAALDREAARGGVPDSFRSWLKRIQTQSSRLATLVDQLLDVSRLSAGRLVLHREPVDLSELAAEVVHRFADEAARLGTTVTLEAPGPVSVSADRHLLDQVLTNLVSNALKYGGGTPVQVQVDCEREPRLRVWDRGPGVSPEEQDRIFERFERGLRAVGQLGMGLGLWIVREIVTAHQGTVRVESRPGAGATFEVSLPRGG